jgi:nucleoid-associated protein YgaU
MNKNQAFAAVQPGFDPYSGHADTGGFFSHLTDQIHRAAFRRGFGHHYGHNAGSLFGSIAHAIGGAAKGVAKGVSRVAHDATHPKDLIKDSVYATKYSVTHVALPVVKKAMPVIQTVLKNAGPIGMVASGAIGAMNAGLSGKNLEDIAWAAAEGAAPTGIDAAIKAAESVRHGGNVISNAIKVASTSFTSGTPEELGFNSAINVLKSNASAAAMGVARRALPSEGARRAFDAAVGTVSSAVKGTPLQVRAMSIPSLNLSRPRALISAMTPNLKGVVDALKKNPSLAATHPQLLANQFGTTVATVNDALKRTGGMNILPWRSYSPQAVSFIQKFHPSAPLAALRAIHHNTGGLDDTGTKYIVVKGDSPWAIAQKLSGNGANWTQLKALNTEKNPTIDKNVWVGEILNIPAAWQKPVPAANPAPTPSALPSVPQPTIAPLPTGPVNIPSSVTVPAGILQAKSTLVAWNKTDGVNEAGVTDYGQQAVDMSTTMGPRDTLELASFQAWYNKTFNSTLNMSGNLDAATLAALQSWAEDRAARAIPIGTVMTQPDPGDVTNPNVTTIPVVVGGNSTPPPTPVVAPAKPSHGGGIALPAIGAIAGGLLFGVPGALIGGAAGAAIS